MNTQSALPREVSQLFRHRQAEVSPALHFQMGISLWDARWEKQPGVSPVGGHINAELLNSLTERQQALATAQGAEIFQLKGRSPLLTGMGIEHPLENGFAFLSPYGLPYLAGSSIRGVLRQAAERMALLAEYKHWHIGHVWALFGFDASAAYLDKKAEVWRSLYEQSVSVLSEEALTQLKGMLGKKETPTTETLLALNSNTDIHFKGALQVWDSFPQAKQMGVEIMTPHQGSYHVEGKEAPHDCSEPVPIQFLCVPAQTDYQIVVNCQPLKVHAELCTDWRERLPELLQYACAELGFGAKTSAGYGQMQFDLAERQAQQQEAQAQAELAAMPEHMQALVALRDSSETLNYSPGQNGHSRLREVLKHFQAATPTADEKETFMTFACEKISNKKDKLRKEIRAFCTA